VAEEAVVEETVVVAVAEGAGKREGRKGEEGPRAKER
jgi:hypothetical protein